jgi:hypothetical protein
MVSGAAARVATAGGSGRDPGVEPRLCSDAVAARASSPVRAVLGVQFRDPA